MATLAIPWRGGKVRWKEEKEGRRNEPPGFQRWFGFFMLSERQPKCLQECGEFSSSVFPEPGHSGWKKENKERGQNWTNWSAKGFKTERREKAIKKQQGILKSLHLLHSVKRHIFSPKTGNQPYEASWGGFSQQHKKYLHSPCDTSIWDPRGKVILVAHTDTHTGIHGDGPRSGGEQWVSWMTATTWWWLSLQNLAADSMERWNSDDLIPLAALWRTTVQNHEDHRRGEQRCPISRRTSCPVTGEMCGIQCGTEGKCNKRDANRKKFFGSFMLTWDQKLKGPCSVAQDYGQILNNVKVQSPEHSLMTTKCRENPVNRATVSHHV